MISQDLVKSSNSTLANHHSSIYRLPGHITTLFIIDSEVLSTFHFISQHPVRPLLGFHFEGRHCTRIHRLLEGTIDTQGLFRHVTSPTHSYAYTIVLRITLSSHDLLSNIIINEVTHSDHRLISSNISADTSTLNPGHSSLTPQQHQLGHLRTGFLRRSPAM